MKSVDELNPYLIHLNYGALSPLSPPPNRRMTIWYEIELITDADERGGVLTEGFFLPAKRGIVYVRKPGMIVQGFRSYSYRTVIFDAVHDPQLQPLYDEGESCLYKKYDPDFLEYLRRRDQFFDCLDKLPQLIELSDDEAARRLYSSIFHAYLDQSPRGRLQVKSLIYQLILLLNDEISDIPSGNSHGANSITMLQRHIDTHYAEQMDLAAMSRSTALSREYLCRQFKKVVGTSPIEYLLKVRLFHAKQRLLNTDDPVRQIAEQCGFSCEQYFFMAFKRSAGMTPNQYRRRSGRL